MIWYILISESVSVCGRYVVGLFSVWVRDCRSAVGYDSSIVLMVGFQSVSCRLFFGQFHTESFPKWPRHEPNWFYGVLSNIVGGRQLTDSLKILRFLSVSCRFGRCDWGITQCCAMTQLATTSGLLHWHRVILSNPPQIRCYVLSSLRAWQN